MVVRDDPPIPSVKHGAQFKGRWVDRIEHLFTCGVDFSGKEILDVGCNMGIVGYEICKHGPAHYHGIEVLKEHVKVAQSIFLAVGTPHWFDNVDLSKRRDVLNTSYDVTLYLAVHQHIARTKGYPTAEVVALDVMARTKEFLIFRGPEREYFAELAAEGHFEPWGEVHRSEILYPLQVFKKVVR